tara:strand:- start:380 stop:667 length:288 start_codon:yes stop_codon:yes gene_type:complete
MKNLKTFDQFINEALNSKEKNIIKSEADWDGRILGRWADEFDGEVTSSQIEELIDMVGPDTDEFEDLYDKANAKKKQEIVKYFADLSMDESIKKI